MNRGAPLLMAGLPALAFPDVMPAFVAQISFVTGHRTGWVYRNWLWYITFGSSAARAIERSSVAFFCAATAAANVGSFVRARLIASSSVMTGAFAGVAGAVVCAGTGADGIATCC
jgi:hypothetical protein